jgi:hypothetical protein
LHLEAIGGSAKWLGSPPCAAAFCTGQRTAAAQSSRPAGKERIAAMVMDALPPERRARLRKARLAHVIVMAFDGFAIHRHLHPHGNPIDDATIGAVAAMLLGEPARAA